MEFLSVLVAAIVAFGSGAVWYMKLAEPWMIASKIPRGPDGKPEGGENPVLYGIGFAMHVIVAGMMRHVFELGEIETLGKALLSGAGIGLFFIAPWIVLNNSYGGRPFALSAIDGGYAALACTIMGGVLVLF